MRRFIAILGLALLAGCGSDSSTSPTVSLDGTWSLQSINGAVLPYTETSGSSAVTVTSSVLTLSSNGTYSETLYYRLTTNGQTTTGSTLEQGTWTSTNGSITFTDQTDGGVQYQGSVSGNTLTEINSGYTSVYSRQ